MFKHLLAGFGVAIASIATNSFAQDSAQFSVGMAYINSASPYKDVGATSRALPYGSFESGDLRLSVQDGISYRVFAGESSELRLNLAPNFEPYKSTDSTALNGMDRDMGVDGVLAGSFEIARGSTVRLKAATDLSNTFNGHLVDVSFGQFIPLGGIPTIFSLGSKWYDGKRSQHMYGVYASEVVAGRAEYAPGAVAVPYLSVNAFMNVTENINAFVNVSANFLPNEVTSSPIVSQKTTVSTMLGLAYNF
ncbi:MAG: MipA/OmpV family protein [Paracoccaceae bacterium]